jgi:hypothetical protein
MLGQVFMFFKLCFLSLNHILAIFCFQKEEDITITPIQCVWSEDLEKGSRESI